MVEFYHDDEGNDMKDEAELAAQRAAVKQVAHDGLIALNQRYELGLTLISHQQIMMLTQAELVALISTVVDKVTEDMY